MDRYTSALKSPGALCGPHLIHFSSLFEYRGEMMIPATPGKEVPLAVVDQGQKSERALHA
jgi:hypothetical protein